MLSRHILRVKLMQALFAYEQHKKANRQWAMEYVENELLAENSVTELQHEKLTEKQKREVQQLLIKESSNEVLNAVKDTAVKATAKKAIRLYLQHNKKKLTTLKKDLTTEVGNISYWYHSILGLLLAFMKVAKSYQKTDHSPFCNNVFILALESSTKLHKLIASNSVNWDNEKIQVISWFRDIINVNPIYLEYIKSPSQDLKSQDQIIKHIIRRLILKGEINDYFVKQDIKWFENQYIVKNMLEKTIKLLNTTTGKVDIPKLSLDLTTDRLFLKSLFEKTVNIEADKKEMIAQNTKNWEVDRLPLIDRIVLELAITEIIHCPEVPVKVSINEYIEIAKRYSTDNSPQFINGILDTIATKLQENGEIKKSGRGLIDNK